MSTSSTSSTSLIQTLNAVLEEKCQKISKRFQEVRIPYRRTRIRNPNTGGSYVSQNKIIIKKIGIEKDETYSKKDLEKCLKSHSTPFSLVEEDKYYFFEETRQTPRSSGTSASDIYRKMMETTGKQGGGASSGGGSAADMYTLIGTPEEALKEIQKQKRQILQILNKTMKLHNKPEKFKIIHVDVPSKKAHIPPSVKKVFGYELPEGSTTTITEVRKIFPGLKFILQGRTVYIDKDLKKTDLQTHGGGATTGAGVQQKKTPPPPKKVKQVKQVKQVKVKQQQQQQQYDSGADANDENPYTSYGGPDDGDW